MPLLVNTIRKSDAIFPLLKSMSFAIVSDDKRTKKIVAFAYVLVPHGNDECLFVKFIWSRLETKFLIENWIQISPLHVGLLLLISVRIRFDLTEKRIQKLFSLMCLTDNCEKTCSLTNGSENPLLSLAIRLVHRLI